MGKLFSDLFHPVAKDIAQGFAHFPFSRSVDYLRLELMRRAMLNSADFVEQHMPNALFCHSKLDHMDLALTQKGKRMILEFGVYEGTTINFIAKRCPDEAVYGFDSFEGLPEHWAGNRYSKRNFNRKGKAPNAEGNVELVIGWFNETLPGFLDAHGGRSAFSISTATSTPRPNRYSTCLATSSGPDALSCSTNSSIIMASSSTSTRPSSNW